MQTEPSCFHSKQINFQSLKTISSNFSSHVEKCPDCIGKIKGLQEYGETMTTYLNGFHGSKDIVPELRRELREAIEIARPTKVKVLKKEAAFFGRGLVLNFLSFLSYLFIPRNIALMVFAVSFFLVTHSIVNA